MAEITNEDLLVAIQELSSNIKELKTAFGNKEEVVTNRETEMQEMKAELKRDIRKLDMKYKILTQDVMDVRADMTELQEQSY